MNRIFKIAIIIILFTSCEEPTRIVKHAPVIHAIHLSRTIVNPNEYVNIEAHVTDEDKGDKLSFLWQCSNGHFNNTKNNPTQWFAPDSPDTCTILLTVSDNYFEVSESAEIIVATPKYSITY